MKKTSQFLCLILLFVATKLYAQEPYTLVYTSDSTTVSVIFPKSIHFDKNKTLVKVDLADILKFKKPDTVKVYINLTVQTLKKTEKLLFKMNVLGNKYQKAFRTGTYEIKRKWLFGKMQKSKTITFSFPELKTRPKTEVWIDSIDMTSI